MSLKDGVTPKLGDIENGLQKTSGKAKALGKSVMSVGNIMKGALVTGAVAGFVQSTIKAYETQVKAEKSVERALLAQGETAQQASADLKEWQAFASQQQDITAFGDESTLSQISGLISQGFGKKDIKDIVAMSQDIARNTGDEQENVITTLSAYVKTGARAKALAKQYKLNVDLLGKGTTESERLAEVWNAFSQSANKGASTGYLKSFSGQVEALKGRVADLNEPVGHLFSTLMGYGNDPNATFISTLDKAVVDATADIDNMAKKADELGGGITGVGLACLEAHPIITTLFLGGALAKGIIILGDLTTACKTVAGAISGVRTAVAGLQLGVEGLLGPIGVAIALLTALIELGQEWNALEPEVKEKLNETQRESNGVFQSTPDMYTYHPSIFDKTNATGTNYFGGGFTEVGEHGGEILNLPNGTQIIPHDVSSKMGGGYTINCPVTVQGNVIGNSEFVNYMGQQIASRVSLAISNC